MLSKSTMCSNKHTLRSKPLTGLVRDRETASGFLPPYPAIIVHDQSNHFQTEETDFCISDRCLTTTLNPHLSLDQATARGGRFPRDRICIRSTDRHAEHCRRSWHISTRSQSHRRSVQKQLSASNIQNRSTNGIGSHSASTHRDRTSET